MKWRPGYRVRRSYDGFVAEYVDARGLRRLLTGASPDPVQVEKVARELGLEPAQRC